MILFKVTLPAIGAVGGADVTARVMTKFEVAAGPLIIARIQNVLGHSALYSLSAEYAAQKPKMPGFRRIAGKDAEQPLILTAAMYDAIEVNLRGNSLVVEVDPAKGIADDGFDYAEYWESGEGSKRGFSGVDYLGKGFDGIEDDLAEMLADLIVGEMGL